MTNPDARRKVSIIGLARELVGGTVGLIRTEIASARQEAGEGAGRLKGAAIVLGIALVLLFLTLMALVVVLVAVVDIFLPLWASALIVFAVLAALAVLIGILGVRRLSAARSAVTIPQTRASIQEDIAWAKRLLKRD
ncbi:MAG: phage holin family protein [Chloroflexota bacterium]|nr:phage holin family protein [Chloroflexota bacterium]